MAKKLYLIDGSGFIFRAYHALPRLTRSDGTPMGAVYGFMNMMLKLLDDTQADYFAVIFDAGRKTFRNRIYDQYKANRPPPPDDLIPQFQLVRDAVIALNLPAIELTDYEADDIIATYARQAQAQGMEVIIVSSDKDLMQLISPGITMLDGMKQKTISDPEVFEKFGVPPNKVLDVLALIGDSSDNIPGVPGIGPKTAAELIQQFGDLDGVLARTAEIKQNKRRESIEQHKQDALMSRELAKLIYDVPLPPLEELVIRAPDHQRLVDFVTTMEFKTLTAKLTEKLGVKAKPTIAAIAPQAVSVKANYTLVQDEKTLQSWIEEATRKGIIAFDTETTSLNASGADLVGVSLGLGDGKACYIPVGHVKPGSIGKETNDLFSGPVKGEPVEGQIPLAKALSMLKPLLSDPAVLKIGQNIKYDQTVLKKYGVEVTPIEDTMLMSYVLDAGLKTHNMDDLAMRYLTHKTITYDEVTGTGKNKLNFAEVALDKALDYAAEDADVTYRLRAPLQQRLFTEHMMSVYEAIERPLAPVIAVMESTGIRIDRDKLGELSKDFGKRLVLLETEIHQIAGMKFNIASPKQMGEVLFDKMQLGGGKKSAKTGAYNTGAGTLEELAEAGHEIAKKLLEWRQWAKLKNTYTDALVEDINPRTGRVHTCFSMAVTATGRLSSTDPNLQNIPIRTEEGRSIRQAFVTDKGFKLISADYSQIELRLLAHIADIGTLKTAFHEGRDIHAVTASQMFNVPLDQVTGDLRRHAKTINFGLIYGMGTHGLATRMGIPRTEAAAYIEAYFKQYPGIRDYMERSKQYARDHGFVMTQFGRKCHLPDINTKGPMRQYAERAAINYPLQGSAADIIKMAMIRVQDHIASRHADTSMLLTVHDELVLEAPEAKAPEVAAQVKKIMEGITVLSVPLAVDVGVGDNWGAIH